MTNVREESWGPFGRGWSNELFQANEIAPRHFPLIAYPKAWTLGTNGPVTTEVVYARTEKEEDFPKRIAESFAANSVMTAPDAQLKRILTRRAIVTLTMNWQPSRSLVPSGLSLTRKCWIVFVLCGSSTKNC